MLYMSETYLTTKSEKEKLTILQSAIQQRMCGVSVTDRINNKELRKRSGLQNVVNGTYIVRRM